MNLDIKMDWKNTIWIEKLKFWTENVRFELKNSIFVFKCLDWQR